ncbi:MAG: haloacid dehalogenase type II [Pseudomonadota bacterium]
MSGVKALFFDVFGTVVDWRSSIAREVHAFADDQGLEGDWEAFADRWRGLYQPAMEEVRSQGRSWVILDTLHGENLDKAWAETGFPALDAGEREHLVRAWHRLDPWPDAVEGLTRLRSKYIIAPVSNGNIALITNMAKRAGLPWDVVLGAEVAKAYKPMPEAYLRSASALALKPEECMMVAAHNDDLHAAKAQGLSTAFVPRPLENGPAGKAETEPTGDWDHVAESFVALAEAVGA